MLRGCLRKLATKAETMAFYEQNKGWFERNYNREWVLLDGKRFLGSYGSAAAATRSNVSLNNENAWPIFVGDEDVLLKEVLGEVPESQPPDLPAGCAAEGTLDSRDSFQPYLFQTLMVARESHLCSVTCVFQPTRRILL
eukprot:TRINITY_DN66714_c10_g1_i2.p1 TRINITY_DN66714_c10_g1~~TRINITY_DN66714_c10_g1_i2.p1  ORF type:complete len:139 (-),score=16.09 TRINITY_DN66714_c10_g1_i2:392-808(-)